jgi:hypothetical protein
VSTFIEMVSRIATELRRANLTAQIKDAINDAITEAGKTRFWFNEADFGATLMSGDEYIFDDTPFIEVDYIHTLDSPGRTKIPFINEQDVFDSLVGSDRVGKPEYATMYQGKLRFYPRADKNYDLIIGAHTAQLSPYPLTADTHTNAWLKEGELYIRALAKRNLLRDTIRDYGEAKMLEAIAADYKEQLLEQYVTQLGGNTLQSTQF